MAASLSSLSSGGFSKMPLSEREMELPPWTQMLTNGALDPSLVTKSDSRASSIITDSEQEDNFSDGDISDIEHLPIASGMIAAHQIPILELRNYQKELAENALRGDNTIICAPTGSGKTRVATFIILEHFKRSERKKTKIAFFAKTVPLAVQQYKALCKYLPSHEIILLTGESGEPLSLHMLLKYSDVVVMTPQILENHLTKNLLPHLGVFSMLVFDECHHTRKKDPYQVLMTSYLKMKDKIKNAKEKGENINYELPQIVGLTATIGVDKAVTVEDAVKNILKVCGSLDVANLSTVRRNRDELAKYVPVPEEELIPLRERNDDESAIRLGKIMEKLENQLKHHNKELNDSGFCTNLLKDLPVNRKDQKYEQWAVNAKKNAKEVAIHDRERETNIHVRLSIIILEYLIAYRTALEAYDLVELKDVIDYLEKCFDEFKHEEGTAGENRVFTYFQELKSTVLSRHGEDNPNLRILIKVLRHYLIAKGEKSRGIIFVRTRALAEALSTWLNRCGFSAVRKLNACIFTGSNVSEEKGGTSQAHQEAIIHRFRSGEIRLLVATSVAEEGLDIPECNLVIKYNHVGTEVSTVQTRGRSRAFGGMSVLLAMGKILQRERINRGRVELMKQAIERIQDMDPVTFKKAIEKHQRQLLQEAYIADMLNKTRTSENQYIPLRMVCAWCRQIAVDGTNIKIIADCHHVSTDRNLLDHIEVIPAMKPKEIGDSLVVGTVKCRGEPEPGSRCKKKLGRVIKHQEIPFVAVDIECFAFDLGEHRNLEVFKKWREAPFTFDELSFEDIERYLKDDRVLPNPTPEEKENATMSDDDDNDEEDHRSHNTTPKTLYASNPAPEKKEIDTVSDDDNDILDEEEAAQSRNTTPKILYASNPAPEKKEIDTMSDDDNDILDEEEAARSRNTTPKTLYASNPAPEKKEIDTVSDGDNDILDEEEAARSRNTTPKIVYASSPAPEKKEIDTMSDDDNDIPDEEEAARSSNTTPKTLYASNPAPEKKEIDTVSDDDNDIPDKEEAARSRNTTPKTLYASNPAPEKKEIDTMSDDDNDIPDEEEAARSHNTTPEILFGSALQNVL